MKHFGPAGGSIVNVSSAATSLTPPNTAVYTATKATVDAITRSLAKELGPRNVRVNAINPGMVQREGMRAAGLAVFLASSDSRWIMGETLLVAGGLR